MEDAPTPSLYTLTGRTYLTTIENNAQNIFNSMGGKLYKYLFVDRIYNTHTPFAIESYELKQALHAMNHDFINEASSKTLDYANMKDPNSIYSQLRTEFTNMFSAIVPSFDKDKDYIRMRWIAEALMTLLTGMEKVYMYQQAYITYIEELRLKLSEKEFNDMTNAENDSNHKILDFFRERDTFMQRITDKELQAIKGFILFHHYDDNTFKNKDLYKKALERAAKDILKYDEAKRSINKRSFNKFVNVLNSYKTVEDIEKKLNESNIVIEDETVIY